MDLLYQLLLYAIILIFKARCASSAVTAVSYFCDQSTDFTTATDVAPDSTTVPLAPDPSCLTIGISNSYDAPLSLSFGSNEGITPSMEPVRPTDIAQSASTRYVFPTGWAGRIGVGRSLNENNSKIEGSLNGPSPYIDVSYIDGFSVPITCSSGQEVLSGCNIDLFKQDLTCPNLAAGAVCLNPNRVLIYGPADPFFEACAGAAYTYPHDDEATAAGSPNLPIDCCVGTSCKAPSRQRQQS